MEITSKSTKNEDQEIKPKIYAALGVREYFQYDPTGDYLNPRLQGARLAEGNYQAIAATTLPNGVLCFYNPVTGQTLLTHEEEVQRSQRLAAKLRELDIDPDAL